MSEKINKIMNKAIKLIPDLISLICLNIDVGSVKFIKFRVKSYDSYIKRMKRLNLKFDEVDDLIGLCIVTDTQDMCYDLVKKIKNIENIKIISINDHIALPCGVNLYQAIHIKFQFHGSNGEIQIKTEEMYNKAQASYANYKENTNK